MSLFVMQRTACASTRLLVPVISNHGEPIKSAAPGRRRGSASNVARINSFICAEYPTALRLNRREKLTLSSSPSRLIGVSATCRKGYRFSHSSMIVMPTDHTSPAASYFSPFSRSGDIYRYEPTEVFDMAMELSSSFEMPKSDSFTWPNEFYRKINSEVQ